MTLRIAVIGNCHAQYFGAALGTLPSVEVRTVGIPYPGPISFQSQLPTFIHGKHVQRWLDEGERGLVLQQVTAATRFDLYNRITSNRAYPMVRFPYVKFHALVAGEPTPELIESDREYNTASFAAAGYPIKHLERLESLARREFMLFEYNHFTGRGFSILFKAMMRAGLSEHLPGEALEALVRRMEVDSGISNTINAVQRTRYQSPLTRRMDEPLQVWREVRTEPPAPIWAHGLFRAAASHYRESGRPAYMGILLRLYREHRYQTWAEIIIEQLIEKGHAGLAMLVLGNRIGWEDARGYLLVRALKYVLEFRRSPMAYAALRRFAAKHPDTTLPLVLRCCEHIQY